MRLLLAFVLISVTQGCVTTGTTPDTQTEDAPRHISPAEDHMVE